MHKEVDYENNFRFTGKLVRRSHEDYSHSNKNQSYYYSLGRVNTKVKNID